ncbi:MAG: hypothetical protein LUG13_07555 [Oscillospiraceae bacterium]|nr:hypothetical protein [Oscillospiraceae bacterium]
MKRSTKVCGALLAAVFVIQLIPYAAQAKTLESAKCENLFFYALNAEGKSVLLKVIELDELKAISHGQPDNGDINYYASTTDNFPTTQYVEARGITLPELVDYVSANATMQGAHNLTYAGNDVMRFCATDGGGIYNRSWTYDALYGEPRYYFEGLYDSNYGWTQGWEICEDSNSALALETYYQAYQGSDPYYEDKRAVFNNGTESSVILGTTGLSGRTAFNDTNDDSWGELGLAGYIAANGGVAAGCLDGMLSDEQSLRLVIPMTEADLMSGHRTCYDHFKWIYNIRLDMVDAPNIPSEGTVAEPVVTMTPSDDGGTLSISIACDTPGASIYYSYDGAPQILYTGTISMDVTGRDLEKEPVKIWTTAVREGWDDAGILTSGVNADGTYPLEESQILDQQVTITSGNDSTTGNMSLSAAQTGDIAITIEPNASNGLSILKINGRLYPFDSGAYSGKRIVGDFTVANNSNYTITDARIEKASDSDISISIAVLDKNRNTTYEISGKITSGNYAGINTYAQTARTKYLASNDQADYNDLLVKLDLKVESSSEQTIVADTNTSSTQLISAYATVASNSPKKELEDFSFLELNTLLDGIRTCDTGILWLSDLDFEVSSEFFTETSMKIETDSDTSSNIKYRVYKYNFQDLHGSYLTRITLMQYIKHSDINTSSGKPQFEVKIANSLILEYNGAGGVLLYLDDAGFKISNIKILIDNVRVTDAAHSDTELFFKSFATTGHVSSISDTGELLASNASVVIASAIPVALWGALLSSMVAVVASSISISNSDTGLNETGMIYSMKLPPIKWRPMET